MNDECIRALAVAKVLWANDYKVTAAGATLTSSAPGGLLRDDN